MASKSKRPKALVLVPHFFNKEAGSTILFGSSDTENESKRKSQVENCQNAIHQSFQELDFEYTVLKVGIKGFSLLGLDLEIETKNPRFLPWAAMDHANELCVNYDFVIIIEDDIQINTVTLSELISFNSQANSDSILIPNRVEMIMEQQFCTDLIAMPGWKMSSISLNGKNYREPINIHSGVLLLTSEKFRKAYENRPFKEPTKIIGDYMASAFANMHANFKIYRALPTSNQVTVLHLDSWVQRQIDNNLLEVDDFLERLRLERLEAK